MKLFLLALACLASANGEVTCDECVASMGKLIERLSGDESIQEQIGILLGNICPGAEDPAACETGIGAAWPDIARAMYPVFLEGTAVCGQIMGCQLREWTCDECTGGLAAIGDVVPFLQGDAFCGQHTDQASCPDDVDRLMPLAMPILAAVLTETAPEICQDINGVR